MREVERLERREPEGFDSLVDRLMNMEGLDREEAEEMAVATLAAGATGGDGRVNARQQSGGAGQVEQPGEPSQPFPVAAAPAASVEQEGAA